MRFERSVSRLLAAPLIGLALVACSVGVSTSLTRDAIVLAVEPSLRLVTDDRESLDALLARWAGAVLMELDRADAGDGRGVGVNWIGEGADLGTHPVPDRTLAEATSGPTLGGRAYTPNPFSWPTPDVGSPQVIGIVEAWRDLAAAGRLVLACAAMILTSSVPADSTFLLTGCEVDVAFGTLGSRTLVLCGTDPQGASDVELATITVIEPDRRATNPDPDRASRGHARIVRTW